MPKLYVAECVYARGDDHTPALYSTRLASGSLNKLKKKLKEYPDTEWCVQEHDFKFTLDTVCLLIEGELPLFDRKFTVHVNESAQVRNGSKYLR